MIKLAAPAIALLAAALVAVVAPRFVPVIPTAQAACPAVPGDCYNPHTSGGPLADNCAVCHRTHVAKGTGLVRTATPQSQLCLTCHNGTGAVTDVQTQYSDPLVLANDPATSSFYSHPSTTTSNHTSAYREEFRGVSNRHAECSDCHNPHQVNSSAPSQTASGWTNSGALAGITGVDNTYSWRNPIGLEYELCLKCHSSYTMLLGDTQPSYQKTDAAAVFATTSASFHPVEARGTNQTAAMTNSLAGGTRWQFTTNDTIRCENCHGNYRVVGSGAGARLSSHTSRYRSILIANYRDRVLRVRSQAYNSGDFALCFLCHSSAPFTDTSKNTRTDTNFRLHGFHVSGISGSGSSSVTNIDATGAGAGNAICAECHFRTHGTRGAYLAADQTNLRIVNFAPNIQPSGGSLTWTGPTNKGCTLLCHGMSHTNERY